MIALTHVPLSPSPFLISVFNSDDSQAAQSHEELAFFVNRLPCYVNSKRRIRISVVFL